MASWADMQDPTLQNKDPNQMGQNPGLSQYGTFDRNAFGGASNFNPNTSFASAPITQHSENPYGFTPWSDSGKQILDAYKTAFTPTGSNSNTGGAGGWSQTYSTSPEQRAQAQAALNWGINSGHISNRGKNETVWNGPVGTLGKFGLMAAGGYYGASAAFGAPGAAGAGAGGGAAAGAGGASTAGAATAPAWSTIGGISPNAVGYGAATSGTGAIGLGGAGAVGGAGSGALGGGTSAPATVPLASGGGSAGSTFGGSEAVGGTTLGGSTTGAAAGGGALSTFGSALGTVAKFAPLVIAGMTYNNQKDAAEAYKALLNKQIETSDPFGPERAQYQQQLQQLMSNPEEFLNSPQIRFASDAAARKMASMGYNQSPAQAQAIADASIGKYYEQANLLAGLAGSNISPNSGALNTAGANAINSRLGMQDAGANFARMALDAASNYSKESSSASNEGSSKSTQVGDRSFSFLDSLS